MDNFKKQILSFVLRSKYSSKVLFLYRTLVHIVLPKSHTTIGQKINIIELENYRNTFFGYYDKNPFNPVRKNLIAFHANNHKSYKKPSPFSHTSIILYDIGKNDIREIAKTYAWNWQQGSRLHWLNSEKLIYNFFDEASKKYKSSIFNIDTDEYKIIPYPVQDSFMDDFIISIDYSALNSTRPDYGYRNIPDQFDHDVVYYDLKSNTSKLLFNAKDLANDIIGTSKFSRDLFRVNHIHISPDGSRYVFIFRYNTGSKRNHYLYLYKFQDENLENLLSNEIISHYKWIDNSNLLFWGTYRNKSGYHIINVNSKKVISTDFLIEDGHPSVIDKNNIVTDTYPNKKGRRLLYKLNLSDKTKNQLASFYEPPIFGGETRCDLHPNYNLLNETINVDCVIKKRRKLVLLQKN